jgi:Protein of unknown function (DUF3379)
VNCEEARLLIGADPAASPPGIAEHLQTCAACRAFSDEMRAFEGRIHSAMAQPPPPLARRRPAWRQWALAASAVLATVLASVWLLRPNDTLAHEVVAHVQEEPNSWFAREHVSAAAIDKTLRAGGVQLNISSDRIMYAQSCWFRGHYVPHLVLQTTRGPATVMLLRHEKLSAPRRFREEGMTGLIVPAGEGSIAVLARGAVGVDDIASQMQQGVHWLPAAN